MMIKITCFDDCENHVKTHIIIPAGETWSAEAEMPTMKVKGPESGRPGSSAFREGDDVGITTIHFKGKRVYLVDYSRCKNREEMLGLLEDLKRLYERSPGLFLLLNDFSGNRPHDEFLDRARRYAAEIFDSRTIKAAVVGVEGVLEIIFEAYNMVVKKKHRVFRTRKEALEYLAG